MEKEDADWIWLVSISTCILFFVFFNFYTPIDTVGKCDILFKKKPVIKRKWLWVKEIILF